MLQVVFVLLLLADAGSVRPLDFRPQTTEELRFFVAQHANTTDEALLLDAERRLADLNAEACAFFTDMQRIAAAHMFVGESLGLCRVGWLQTKQKVMGSYVLQSQPAQRLRNMVQNLFDAWAQSIKNSRLINDFKYALVRQLQRDLLVVGDVLVGCRAVNDPCGDIAETEVAAINAEFMSLMTTTGSHCFGAASTSCELDLVQRWTSTDIRNAQNLRGVLEAFLDDGVVGMSSGMRQDLVESASKCGTNHSCVTSAMIAIVQTMDKYVPTLSEVDAAVAGVSLCWRWCAPLKAELAFLSRKMVLQLFKIVEASLSLSLRYCNDPDCVPFPELRKTLMEEINTTILTVTARLATGAPAVDPAIALAGLILFCIVLVCVVGLAVVGVVWKTILGKVAWPLLLAGIAVVASFRIFLWATSLMRPQFPDVNVGYPIFPVVGLSVSVFVSLVLFLLSLLMVFLFIVMIHVEDERRKRVLQIGFILGAACVAGATIASIICTYTITDMSMLLSYYLAGPVEGQKDAMTLDELAIIEPLLLVLLVPMTVLSAFSFLLSSIKFVYSLAVLRSFSASLKHDPVRVFALKCNVWVFAITALAFLTQLVCAVLRFPALNFFLPSVVDGLGTVAVETTLCLAYLVLVLVSWWSSLVLTTAAKAREALLTSSNEETDIPLRYRE